MYNLLSKIQQSKGLLIAITVLATGHLVLAVKNLFIGVPEIVSFAGYGLQLLAFFVVIIWIVRRDEALIYADRIAEHQMTHLADFATDLYWQTNLQGTIVAAGGRLMSAMLIRPQMVIGHHYLGIIHLEEKEMQRMKHAIRNARAYSDIHSILHDVNGDRYVISLCGTPVLDKDKKLKGYLGVGTNITERVASQEKINYMAEHDMLTGLANRYHFHNRIKQALDLCGRGYSLAMFAIDLDGFKRVNDTYGHQTGDALLRIFAKRLSGMIREDDWAARLGGDEFVIISPGVADATEARALAARLLAGLNRPYRVGGLKLTSTTTSIGIACAPLHAQNTDDLMKYADQALYRAKTDGRACYRLYDPDNPETQNDLEKPAKQAQA